VIGLLAKCSMAAHINRDATVIFSKYVNGVPAHSVRELEILYTRMRHVLPNARCSVDEDMMDSKMFSLGSGTHLLKSCDSSPSIFMLNDLTVDPYPLKMGARLAISLSGELSKEITGGKYMVHVDYGGIGFDKNGDVCEALAQGGDAIKCPVKAGAFVASMNVEVPRAFPGTYSVRAEAVTESGERIFCYVSEMELE